MLNIAIVTTNRGKFLRAQQALDPFGIKVNQVDQSLIEIQGTLEEIACDKARQAFGVVDGPVIVTDAALCIDALDGWPGIYVKDAVQKLGPEGFLRLMSAFPNQKDRCGSWLESLAYMDCCQVYPRVWIRKDPGVFTREAQGAFRPDMKSTLWTVWQAQGYDVTLAEMTDQERARYRAINNGAQMFGAFARWFKRAIE